MMKLTLTDDEGLVLAEWSIGDSREYDIDDLDACPQHEIYAADGKDMDMEQVTHEIRREAKRIKTGEY